MISTPFKQQMPVLGLQRLAIVFAAIVAAATANGQSDDSGTMVLTEKQVGDFAELALRGLKQEYPNKPSNVMATSADVRSPKQMHPAFYGNFDWHSSVHGHWMLARLLRLNPDHVRSSAMRSILNEQLTADNMRQEAEYFQQKHNRSFERMYGWAWLLQLVRELHVWEDDDAKRWRKNLEPLENVIVSHAMDYLPKLKHPIRVGTHTDTGFALGMELDYARVTGNKKLETLVIEKAKEFYLNDRDYPAHYEPSGHDFFSSGFNEADLMRRVLPPTEFSAWLDKFLPDLSSGNLGGMIEAVEVSDVTDGHLVHLAGLDLSRAWTMSGIAHSLPASDLRSENSSNELLIRTLRPG